MLSGLREYDRFAAFALLEAGEQESAREAEMLGKCSTMVLKCMPARCTQRQPVALSILVDAARWLQP